VRFCYCVRLPGLRAIPVDRNVLFAPLLNMVINCPHTDGHDRKQAVCKAGPYCPALPEECTPNSKSAQGLEVIMDLA